MMWLPLAYRPFLDSLYGLCPGLDNYWLWFLVPLVIGISLVYKGTKVTLVREIPGAAFRMTWQVLLVMGVAAAALYGIHFAVIRLL